MIDTRKPRIALVGSGQIAVLGHLPALQKLHNQGRIELVAICDPDISRAKAAAQQFTVARSEGDWRRLISEHAIDAISVCTPPGPNASISVEALRAGLHVICEKPPGRSLEDAAEMARAAKENPQLVTMVAFNRRYAPLFVQAMARSGRLAPPQAFFGKFTRPGMGGAPSNTMENWITSDGSHSIDLAIAAIGCPHTVSVSRRAVGGTIDNVWTIHLVAKGASAVILFGFAAGRREERFEWVGAGYDVSLELPDNGLWCQQGTPVEEMKASVVTGTTEYYVNYGFLGEYEAFANAIGGHDQEESRADFAYARFFMQVLETVIGCEDGGSRKLLPEATGGEMAAPRPASILKAKLPEKGGRESILFLQPQNARSTYFVQSALSGLGAKAHLTAADDGVVEDAPLATATVLVAGWGAPPLTEESLKKALSLKCIVVLGASVKWAVPYKAALERRIAIYNTADAIAQSVAEHCLLLSLACLRRLPDVNRSLHKGGWPPQPSKFSAASILKKIRKMPGIDLLKPVLRPLSARVSKIIYSTGGSQWNELRGQTVGLIGWGNTARHFAELLSPFGCQILVNSEHAGDEELARVNARRASLGEVLGSSRVISLHKGATEQSRNLLGRDELALIKRGSVLINTARASLIDTGAFLERARKGDIVAALDVFDTEPLPAAHPLRKLSNVILTPHNASSTSQCASRVGSQAMKILNDWIDGAPIAPLSREQLETMT